MTVIAEAFYKAFASGLEGSVVGVAKEFVARVLLPERITRGVIESFYRKALRYRIWHRLDTFERALIYALRTFPKPIKSPVLTSIVRRILLEIELQTTQGKALFYGALLALKRLQIGVLDLVKKAAKEFYHVLLYLGISYLNDPPMYRVYG